MIYNEKQKREAVRELQNFLNAILAKYTESPALVPNGIYDEATQRAVAEFERLFNMPLTMGVNKETWDKIVEVYNDISNEPIEEITGFKFVNYVMHHGDRKLMVGLIQLMLQAIGIMFTNFERVRINYEFDESTKKAVEQIQDLSILPVTGDVDLKTWNRIVDAYNAIELTNNK